MTKLEFMQELESLLPDIPLEEREEALQYYLGYFEDAGEEHEEEIISELGSPSKVASIIKADLNSNAADRENRGYFTERGYQDTIYMEEKYEIVGSAKKESKGGQYSDHANNPNSSENRTYTNNAGTANNTNNTNNAYNNSTRKNNSSNTALILVIGIFTFPIWFPLLMSAFGITIGIIATILGVVFGFGIAGFVMMGVGIVLFITGLVQISVPFVGLLMIGSGLFVLGLGMLFALASFMLCKKVLPALIRGIVELCRLPFKNRSVMA